LDSASNAFNGYQLEGQKNVADCPFCVKLSSVEKGLFLTIGVGRNLMELHHRSSAAIFFLFAS